jgi:hypothetical protein
MGANKARLSPKKGQVAISIPAMNLCDLPNELITHVAQYLTSQSDILQVCLANHRFCAVAMPILWRAPRIAPSVSKSAWRQFVNLLHQDSPIDYIKFIQEIDDVWLFVGGEDEDRDITSKFDSAIDLTPTLPRYSLHQSLCAIMTRCANLKSISLNFHSIHLDKLDWNRALPRLSSLTLKMRVMDSLSKQIFSTAAPDLQVLQLNWAEISDEGLRCIAAAFPGLLCLSIYLTDMDKRARFHRRHENGTDAHISDHGILHLLSICTKLSSLDISRLEKVSGVIFSDPVFLQLRSVTITMNASRGVDLPRVHDYIASNKRLLNLVLVSGDSEDYSGNRVLGEEDLFAMASEGSSHLKSLTLIGFDFFKNIDGFRTYYGSQGSSFLVDEFRHTFGLRCPNVKMTISFQQC